MEDLSREKLAKKYKGLYEEYVYLGNPKDPQMFKGLVAEQLKERSINTPSPLDYVAAARDVVERMKAAKEISRKERSQMPWEVADSNLGKTDETEKEPLPPPPPPLPPPPAPPVEETTDTGTPVPVTEVRLKPQKIMALPPSVLVCGEISTPGAVRYYKLGEDTVPSEDGRGVKISKRTKTSRKVVVDPDERDNCTKLAGQMRTAFKRVCVSTPFGYICHEEKEGKLTEVIQKIKDDARKWNNTASFHFIKVSLMMARIETQSEQVAKDMVWEARSLLQELDEALKSASVAGIRNVANKIKNVVPLYTVEDGKGLNEAVVAARNYATELKAASAEKADEIQAVLDRVNLGAVDEARFQFDEYVASEEIAGNESKIKMSVDAANAAAEKAREDAIAEQQDVMDNVVDKEQFEGLMEETEPGAAEPTEEAV